MKQFLFNIITKLESFYHDKLIPFFVYLKIRIQNGLLNPVIDLIVFISVLIIGYNILTYALHHQSVKTPSSIATVAPIVKNEPTTTVQVSKPIRVFKHNKKIKTEVKLPEPVVQDEKQQVLQVSKIPDVNDNESQVVTSVLNLDTGNVENYVAPAPTPLIAINKHGEVGMYFGVKNGQAAVRLQAKQGIVDIKSVHINAIGSVDQTADGKTSYFVGGGASYNW